MTPYQFLAQMKDPCPDWLLNFTPNSRFDRDAFFSSRVVYYPGFGNDGHAVKLFGSTHAAHCFVYVDNGAEESDVIAALDGPTRRFKGYHTLARVSLTQNKIAPDGWAQHARVQDDPFARPNITPYGFLEVLERDDGFNETHGPQRLAILFLGADGHATYDALFCQAGWKAPFAVLIQDHGFGGNYSSFGKGGVMETVAKNANRKPEWILIADGTEVWEGFLPVPDVEGDVGGQHGNLRRLHFKVESAG